MRTNRAPFYFLFMIIVAIVATLATGAYTEQALPGDEILAYRAASPTLMETKIVISPPPSVPSPAQEATQRVKQKPQHIPAPTVTKVPYLIGHTVPEAQDLLNEAGLQLGEVNYIPAKQAPGTVVRQYPAAGETAARATAVNIWVSQAAPVPIKVPDVVGRSLRDAEAILAKAELLMREAGQEESGYPEGLVARQAPAPGENATGGAVVEVWVAAAPIVSVPDLRGNSVESAAQLLRDARLRLGAQTRQPSLPPGGEIVGQKPPAGTRVRANSAVDVVVGDGARARVPRLTGQPEPSARELLAQAGLRRGRAVNEESDHPEGEVLRQRPGEGTVVARGSAVDYWVAIPQKVAVPRIVGRRPAAAMTELERRALAGEQRGVEESPRPEGEIVRQEPLPDVLVPRGSRVGFWVAAPFLITVPDLSGMTERQASERLGAEGLAAGRVESQESREPKGSVIEQDPPQGTRVPRGTAVNFWVAETPLIEVPELVGSSLEESEKRLSGAGLEAAFEPPVRNNAPKGTILSQDPPGKTRVLPGTRVVVRVSAGPAPVWPWIAGGGAALMLLGGAIWRWVIRPKKRPNTQTTLPPPKPIVRVHLEQPEFAAPEGLPPDPKAPEVRIRVRITPGDSEVAAEKLVVREERRNK